MASRADDQRRNHHYASLMGRLPRPSLVMLISVVVIACTATVAGAVASMVALATNGRESDPSALAWLWLLIPIAVVSVGAYATFPFYFRSFLMRSIADRLGLRYARTGDREWKPPPQGWKVNKRVIYNQVEGVFEGESVFVFDVAFEWWSRHHTRKKNVKKTEHYFQVVELDAPQGVPSFIIGGKLASKFDSVNIPGTDYDVHGKSEKARQRVLGFISEQLRQFLATNPGLVVQLGERRMSVYCNRWLSTHRQVPGNLPAFLEDALQLKHLLSRCRTDAESAN